MASAICKRFMAAAVALGVTAGAMWASPAGGDGGGQALPFVNHGRSERLVEFKAHALVGGSFLTDNYSSCFPMIRQLNSTMGLAYGAGVGVTLRIRDYFGLGTEMNLHFNHSNMDVFTSNTQVLSASNLYMRNSYSYFNVPLFLSWRFNVASNVKWIFDTGAFFSYGIGGHQRQTLYRSLVNDLGQLVYQIVSLKPDFFKSEGTFQNSFHRSDYGLHLSTSLVFNSHFTLGARTQIGLRNLSYVESGIVNPRIHNISFLFMAGWIF